MLLTYETYYTENQVFFNEDNFTISNGDRICYEVTIVDDDIIEQFLRSGFTVTLQNGALDPFFSDFTQFVVRDNEG